MLKVSVVVGPLDDAELGHRSRTDVGNVTLVKLGDVARCRPGERWCSSRPSTCNGHSQRPLAAHRRSGTGTAAQDRGRLVLHWPRAGYDGPRFCQCLPAERATPTVRRPQQVGRRGDVGQQSERRPHPNRQLTKMVGARSSPAPGHADRLRPSDPANSVGVPGRAPLKVG